MHKRQFLKLASLGLLTPLLTHAKILPAVSYKSIPSSGERIPLIGMGSFVNFNFFADEKTVQQRTNLLRDFFTLGGQMIDSSPMYGAAEKNLGLCLKELQKLGIDPREKLLATSKVWTSSVDDGPDEIATSRALWQIDQFDILQVHNLLSWEGHLETLLEMKAEGRLRYVGITTSHGRRHGELEKIMRTQPIDFIQATYNMADRALEQRILPVAAEQGIAVIINRPFQRGELVDWAKKKPLPGFAAEIDCDNWATFLLKFIVSHPAVTCAIPATTRHDHLAENMQAMQGVLPDAAMRQKMLNYFAGL